MRFVSKWLNIELTCVALQRTVVIYKGMILHMKVQMKNKWRKQIWQWCAHPFMNLTIVFSFVLSFITAIICYLNDKWRYKVNKWREEFVIWITWHTGSTICWDWMFLAGIQKKNKSQSDKSRILSDKIYLLEKN